MALGFTYDPKREHVSAVMDSIVSDALGREPSLAGSIYRGEPAKLAHLAFAVLKSCGRDAGLSPNDVGRILHLAHTTADFLFAMRNVHTQIALPHYANASRVRNAIAARQDLPSFRTSDLVQAIEFPQPLLSSEAGEAAQGALTESGETARLVTYRSRISLSRQTMLNDDARAVADLATAAGARAGDLDEGVLLGVLDANAPLRDNTALFHSTRGNLAASGAAPDTTTIGAAVAAMLNQVGPSGTRGIAVPRYLLVPPAIATASRVAVAQINLGSTPATRIEVVTSPHLASASAWFLISDPRQRAGLLFHMLEGSSGPISTAMEHFPTEGVEFQTTHDFAVSVADWRCLYKNPGV